VRAFCTTRGAWRTFRVDRINAIVAQAPATETRPVDDVPNWLTNIAESGEEVVCIVDAATRYLFEPLPGAQWVSLGEGKHAVKFRVATSEFLDHLMLLAGPGAVVVTPKYASAGRALAQSILDAL
jgi:predicted DNA-binding transcriptional regulator YafY